MSSTQEHNLDVYVDKKVLNSYTRTTDLTRVEQVLLDELRKEIREGDRILDIGVGTGRTTPFLRQLSKNYIGIDYAQAMIDVARKSFPEAEFAFGDVRDLSAYKDQEFDLVFFSFNGLDSIGHNDRLIALKEIARVLKRGKLFVFSAHNMNYKHFDTLRHTYQGDLLRKVYYAFKNTYNRLKNKSSHVYDKDYAIITDPGHNYRLLLYYISSEAQVRQLADAGFGNTVVFNSAGNKIGVTQDSSDSSWLYYQARRQ